MFVPFDYFTPSPHSDSILKSRDITLLTKVHLVKAIVLPVVMYGCESWAIKKAECQRIDAFELWYWRRLLRVPWTARRSNQSILKEISPRISLEGMILKLKLQYFGHLMRRVDSLEKTLMLGKIEGRRRGRQRMMVGRHHWLNGHESVQAPGVGDAQGSLVCCSLWSDKELNTTKWLNRTETIKAYSHCYQTLIQQAEFDQRRPSRQISVQLLRHVQLFATPWTVACQDSLSIINFWSLFKLMSIESVIPSSHLILCRPLLLLSSIFPSMRVFSNESVLRIRWPKYWSFNFNISPSDEHPGLIFFRMDWLDLLAVQGTLKSLLQHHTSKASILWHSAFFIVQLSHPYMTTGKTVALTRWTFADKVMSLLFNMLSRLVISFLPKSKHISTQKVVYECS